MEEQYRKGFALACRYLAMKSMHSCQLRKKLHEKGFWLETIDRVILDCHTHHWLNDQQFCAQFVEKWRKQGKSEFQISMKARVHGIPVEEIKPHLQKDNSEALALLISKRYQLLFDPEGLSNRESRIKAIQALMRRGFSMNDIYKAIKDHHAQTITVP